MIRVCAFRVASRTVGPRLGATARNAEMVTSWRVSFSTSTANEKLQAIMEEYRKANFSQTIPSRFVKKVLKATDENEDGRISVMEVERLLTNIGSSDKLSREEIKQIMTDLGCHDNTKEDMSVPISKVRDLFLWSSQNKKKE